MHKYLKEFDETYFSIGSPNEEWGEEHMRYAYGKSYNLREVRSFLKKVLEEKNEYV